MERESTLITYSKKLVGDNIRLVRLVQFNVAERERWCAVIEETTAAIENVDRWWWNEKRKRTS